MIYILRFKNSEYRVLQAEAIDNITYFPTNSREYEAEIVVFCHDLYRYWNMLEAWIEARKLRDKYGVEIQEMNFDHEYPVLSLTEANNILISFWKNKRKDYLDKYGFEN